MPTKYIITDISERDAYSRNYKNWKELFLNRPGHFEYDNGKGHTEGYVGGSFVFDNPPDPILNHLYLIDVKVEEVHTIDITISGTFTKEFAEQVASKFNAIKGTEYAGWHEVKDGEE